MVISYMKEKLKSFLAYWSFSRADTTTTIYIYITCLNLHSDLDISRRNPSLVRNTPYIYGYLICERKITILPCILNFQSGHDHHHLYLYNIKNDKVWTPTVTLTLVVETRVLSATHHTSLVFSYIKKNIKIFSSILKFQSGHDHHCLYDKTGRTDRRFDFNKK
jgi:hypothetical protein